MTDARRTQPLHPQADPPTGSRASAPPDLPSDPPAAPPGSDRALVDDLRVERDPTPGYREELAAVGTHREHHDRPDPIEAMQDPTNRAKLLLAVAAITLLNLILLIAVLTTVMSDAGEQVVVDGVPCIVSEQEDGERVLYCRR